ncbi:MAG: hypothetical protein CHACPFDD_01954 [Phycisphaerae bacterium]|nr:hypothetical protein [Phycisphaerae bacterium]
MKDLNCRDVIEFLDDYVGGVQPATVRHEFDAHLAECPACVDYLTTYRETIRLCRASCREDLPPASAEVERRLIEAIVSARRRA